MGLKRKRPNLSVRSARKLPVAATVTGAVRSEAAGQKREGCPDEVKVLGRGAQHVTIGQPAALILAVGRPQLLVAGRVTSIVSIGPDLSVITECLELGETYLGTITHVSAEQFEARLSRTG